MAAFAGDFDDFSEDDSSSKPLPPEDRLWRHPSELGTFGLSLPLDPITIRRRWLASQPSKASAWTAGLVGALLATGIVALGTHLASAFTAPASTRSAVQPAVVATSDPIRESPAVAALGSTLAAHVANVGRSVVEVSIEHGGTVVHCLGVAVGREGLLLTPATMLAGATSIVVTLPSGASYVGEVVGSDATTRAASSGLALVHINGVRDLAVAPLLDRPLDMRDVYAIAVTSPGGGRVSMGTTSGTESVALIGGPVLVDAIRTDISAATTPAGSLLLDADGKVSGIVTGEHAGEAVATPAWIAAVVSAELEHGGAVVHGWLGIEGATVSAPPGGVRVLRLSAGGAANGAGIHRGDTIISLNGHRVADMMDLQSLLYFARPGAAVPLVVERAGRPVALRAVLRND